MYDVAVVGASFAGFASAIKSAENGARTVLIDDKEIGVDTTPADSITILSLLDEDFIRKSIINRTKGWRIYSPKLEYIQIDVNGAVIDRKITDSLLKEKAERAGVELIDKTKVKDLEPGNNKYLLKTDTNLDVKTNLVIFAHGVNFKFADKLGLQPIQRKDLLPTGLQFEFENTNIDEPKYFHFFLDQNFAPGWKISVNPISTTKGNIAVFTMKDNPKAYATKAFNQHPLLKNMVKNATRVRSWAGKDVIFAKPKRTYADRVLFTGTSAGLGGLSFGYKIGELAGEVAGQCVEKNDFSAKMLAQYEKKWRKKYKDLYTWGIDLARSLITIKNNEIDDFVTCFQEDNFRDVVVGEKYRELIRTMFKHLLRKNPTYSFKFMFKHLLLTMKLAPIFIPWPKYKDRI